MIYFGDTELYGVKIGNTDISAIYAGDLLIYPTDFGNLTAITFEDLTWETDIPSSGGTATSANCSFEVYALFDSGKRKRVTSATTVTGSLVVPGTLSPTRESAGTLTLTASYSGFTDTSSVTVYQAAKTYNNIITYETTNNTILTLPTASWTSSIISHSFNNNAGTIEFANDLTSIPDSAFYACTTLKTITIPDSVTSYGTSSFYDCSGMTALRIGSAVTSIGRECFYNTSGELSIDSQAICSGAGIDSSHTNYQDSIANCFNFNYCVPKQYTSADTNSHKEYLLYLNFDKIIITSSTVTYIGKGAFHSSPVTEYYLGDNITRLGGMSFARLDNGDKNPGRKKPCQKITIGNGCQWLDAYTFFAGATDLTEINMHSQTAPSLGNAISLEFLGVKSGGTFHYPSGSNYSTYNQAPLDTWTFIGDL